MGIDIKIALNFGEINRLLYSPNDVVGTYIHRVGIRTVSEAKTLAPVGDGKDTPPGHLRASIGISLWPGPRNSLEITANTKYATAVHQGSRPHEIRARNPSGNLKFYWTKRQVSFVGPKVNHPGSPKHPPGVGNPFLVNALKIALR